MPQLTRSLTWAFPPREVDRELVQRVPDGPTDRPPLLFVHGEMHGAWCWDEHWMSHAAASGWPCYAISFRGHGTSGGREALHRWRIRDYERDVMRAITTLPEPPVLVGHSLGALVVERLLDRYPAEAAVLISPLPPYGTLPIGLRIARTHPADLLRLLTLRPLPPRADYFFSDRLDRGEAERFAGRMQPESVLAQLDSIRPRRTPTTDTPVLVLGGEDDTLVDPVDVVRTARAYGTEARLFHSMGHDLMLDAGWRAPLELMLHWLDDELGGDELSARG